MSINNLNTYLNVRDAHLRVVSGNVYAQAMNIGGINVETAHGLQSVSDTGNVTSNTLQFSNATTGFVTTANAQIGRDLVVTGNATVSTDLTVSANATVTDTLTVSEHLLASKEATVTGNLHVTTIMSDSNVVAEYTGPHDRPLRKYPEVAMTQNDESATSGYVASASSTATYDTNLQPENAFNGVISPSSATASWQSSDSGYSGTTPFNYLNSGTHTVSLTDTDGTVHYGDWLSLQTPNKIKVSYYKIHTLNDVDNYRPDSFVLLGSNSETDGTWKLLHTETSGMTDPGPEVYTGHVNSTEFYTYHRLLVKSLAGNGGEAYINELEYYGHEEGSGSLDTTLKSVYNVPATTGTQLEVYYDAKDLADGAVTNVNDLSPNSNGGSPTDVSVSDGAFVFNGTSSLLEKTSLSIPGGDNPLTFSFWVKSDDFDNTQYIFRLGDNTTTYQTIALYKNTSSQFVFATWALDFPINYTFTSNQWNHVSLVYPGGGWKQSNLIAYVDGKPYTFGGNVSVGGVGGTVMSLATSLTLRLGGYSSGTQHFNGSIANFRLYSKVLSADQVKELYDYQKDYFLGSKSQVTLYKGHLGVGVTEPSGQLELAGDERIQAYPPRGMTHTDGTATGAMPIDKSKNITYIEGHGEFKASASLRSRQDVDYDGQQPYNAFDYTDSDYLLYGPGSGEDVGYNKTTGYYEDNEYQLSASSGTPYGHWLQLEMPYKINMKSYFIQHHHNDYWPQDWQIWASNDDINWTHIHTYTGGTFDTDPQYYTVAHTGHYKIYTMIITRIKEASSLDRVRIQELRYFGTPGPTTLDKGSLSLTRSLDVPRISRYDVDTETPRPEKLVVDFDTTVNSTPTDISGKGNHGTYHTGASYSLADKAFDFGNSPQGGIRAQTTNFDTSGKHSFVAWMKFESFARWYGLYGIGTNNGSASNFTIYTGTGASGNVGHTGFRLESRGGGRHQDLAWTPVLNTWVHVAVTWDGTGGLNNVNMYIDLVKLERQQLGSYENNATSSITLPSTQAIRVGADARQFDGDGTGANFDGQISNPKFYSEVLEFSEIKKLYNLGRTGRSMVISDTAVGIGRAPEAQLDVRGIGKFETCHIRDGGISGTHGMLDINQGLRTAGSQDPPSHTPPLYITGDINSNARGIEFRHSNQSQGIGFGYNTIYATGYASGGGQDLSLKAFGTGTVRLNGGTAITSDDRLKTNEQYLTNATETLLKLKPQVYDKHQKINEICENPVREAGLITQDVYYDAPELRFLVQARNEGLDAIIPVNIPEEKPFVDDDPTKDPDYSGWGTDAASLNYEGFIPYLIKSNQELYTEIQALEHKDYIQELRADNNRLKNKVAILENRQTHFNTLLVNLTGRIETLERGA